MDILRNTFKAISFSFKNEVMFTDERLEKVDEFLFPGSLETAKQLSSNEKVKDSTGVPLKMLAGSKLLDALPSSLGTHFFFLKRLSFVYLLFFICFPLVSFIYNCLLWGSAQETVQSEFFRELSFLQKLVYNDLIKLDFYPAEDYPTKGILQLVTYLVSTFICYLAYLILSAKIEVHNATRLSNEINIPDYSLIIENLPEKVTTKEIQDFLGSIIGKEVKIHRVELIFNVKTLSDLMAERKKKMTEKAKLESQEAAGKKQNEIDGLNRRISQCLEQFKRGEQFSGKAIVTLEKSSQVEAVLKKTKGTLASTMVREIILNLSFCLINLSRWNSQFELKGKKINIKVAPNPNEIIWRNFGCRKQDEICRKLLSYFVFFATMAFTAVIVFVLYDIYYTKLLETYVETSTAQQKLSHMVVALVMTLCVFVVSIISYLLFEIIGEFLQPKIFSTQYSFLFISNCLHFIFTNIVVQYLAVFRILNKEVEGSEDEETVEVRALMFEFFARNTVLMSLLYWIYPVSDHLFKYTYKIYQIATAFARPGKYTQGELNEMLSPLKFNSAVGVANYTSLLLFSVFYSNYVNTCAIGPLIACFVTYWFEKLLLLRVCATPRKYNFTVTINTFKVLIVFQFILSSVANFKIINDSVFGEFRISHSFVFFICFALAFGCLAYYSNQYNHKKSFFRLRVKMFDLCKKINQKKPTFSKIQEHIEADYRSKNPANPFFNRPPKKFVYGLEARNGTTPGEPSPNKEGVPGSQSFDMKIFEDSETGDRFVMDLENIDVGEEGTEIVRDFPLDQGNFNVRINGDGHGDYNGLERAKREEEEEKIRLSKDRRPNKLW